MKDLLLTPDTQGKTPLIDFKSNGELTIAGRSIVENVYDHYEPVLEWINNPNHSFPSEMKLTVKLEYFNTRSSKMLLNIFKSLESIHLRGKTKVNVTWYYGEDDRDMQEAGNDYQSVVKIPFNIVASN